MATLPERELPAGVSSLVWSGKSTAGTRVPAGRYFAAIAGAGTEGAVAHTQVPFQR